MKFSIIIAARNSREVLLDCLNSIIRCSEGEAYEVIIVDNASSDGSADFYPALEGNVRVIENDMNAGFARACNQGITASSGEFIVLLNPDTMVSPGWLKKLADHFDDDSVGAVGPLSNYVAGIQKFQLYLKSNPSDSLEDITSHLETEYKGKSLEAKFLIGFCLMFRRSLLQKIGLLDDDLILGNEDLELSLRLRQAGLKLLVALDVFVWHRGQASFKQENNPGRWVNFSARLLQAKLNRRMKDFDPRQLWGMDWFQPRPNLEQDRVSIIIPTFNGLKFTQMCLDSIRRCTLHPYEIIVVDNGSSDGTPEYIRTQPNIKFIANSSNRGFPAACNQGIAASESPYVLIMNNDVIVTDCWLSRMFQGFFAEPSAGLIGPRSNDSAGAQLVTSPEYSLVSGWEQLESFAARFKLAAARQFRPTNYLSGLCLLIDRKVIAEIGLFDERFGIGNYEDEDFCRRAVKAGFRLLIANEVYIHHFGSQSFLENEIPYRHILEQNRRIFESKWAESEL